MKKNIFIYLMVISLTGCSTMPPSRLPTEIEEETAVPRQADPRSQEAVFYALGLIDINYLFGGKNPDAGLDCSGMVSYIYNQSAGLKLAGSAADLAKLGHAVSRHNMVPGDLVFFNTLGRPYSHVGIYIGNHRFIHAPKSEEKIRIDRLDSGYFYSHFEEARSLFPD